MTIRDIAVAFGFEVDQASVSKVESSIQGLKNMASRLLGAIGIAFSIKGLSELAQAAADVKALESQFTQVFGDVESEAERSLQAISDYAGALTNRMKGSFTQIAAFTKTTGATEAEALELANRGMRAVADSAAFYDRSLENVTESLQSFLKGNYENDAALGLSCTETTRNAAANQLYGKSFKQLSEYQKQLTLLKMVEDANAASGALGQAARESDTWTNQLGNLSQSLADLKAAAGSTFLKPAIAALKILISLVQAATGAIQNLTSENGLLTRAAEKYHALVKRLQPAMERFARAIRVGFSRATETVNDIAERLGGIGNILKIVATVAASFVAVMTFAKVLNGLKKTLTAIKAIDKAMLAARLKVLSIVAVVAVLMLVIEDFINFMMGNDSVIGTIFDKAGIGADNARKKIVAAWAAVKEFLLEAWDTIRQFAGVFVDSIKAFIDRHGGQILGTFRRVWGIVSDLLRGVWTFICQLAETLFGNAEESIDGSTQTTKDRLLSAWQNILAALSAIFSAIFNVVDAVLNAILTVVEVVFGWVKAFWTQWGSQVLTYFRVLWDSIGRIFGGFLDVVAGIANFVKSVFTGDWKGAWDAVKSIFGAVWDSILAVLTAALESLKLVLTIVLGFIKGLIVAALNGIKSFFVGVWNGIVSFFLGIWSAIASVVATAITGIASVIGNVLNAISGLFGAIWNGIFGIVASALGRIRDFVSGVLAAIFGFFASAWTGIYDTIASVLGWIRNQITSVWSSTYSAIEPLVTAFGYLFETVFEAIHILIGRAMDAAMGVIVSVWTAVSSFAAEVLERIRATFERVWNFVLNVVTTVAEAIASAVVSAWSSVVSFLVPILEWIRNTVSVAWNAVRETITSALSAIRDIVLVVWSTVGSIISGALEVILGSVTSVWNAVVSLVTTAQEAIRSAVASAWEVITSAVLTAMDMISAAVISIWENIGNAVSARITAIRQTIVDGFNAAKEFVTNLAGEALQWGADIIGNIVAGIKGAIGSVAEAVTGVADTIRAFLHFSVPDKGPLTDFESWMPDFMNGLADTMTSSSNVLTAVISALGASIKEQFAAAFDGAKESVSGSMAGIQDVVLNGLNIAVDFLKGLPSEAVQWGKDFIDGLRDGILSGISSIVSAVQNVAENIRAYLHFSVPDKGPLKDYESWMPDFTSGLADGFAEGEGRILDKIQDLASGISVLTQAATAKATTAATTMVSNRTSSVTQNVNIDNTYQGGGVEVQKNVSRAMKKSASDATDYMARGLAYAR